jgi:hypothetical protein
MDIVEEEESNCDINGCERCVRLCMSSPPHDLSRCFATCDAQFQCDGFCGHPAPAPEEEDPNCDIQGCERCVSICMATPPRDLSKCFATCNKQYDCQGHCGHRPMDDFTLDVSSAPSQSVVEVTPIESIEFIESIESTSDSDIVSNCDIHACDACVRRCMGIAPHDLSKCFGQCNSQYSCESYCGHALQR